VPLTPFAPKLTGHGVHASGRSRQPVLQRARPSPSGSAQRRPLRPTQPSGVRRRCRASLGWRGTPPHPVVHSERGPARSTTRTKPTPHSPLQPPNTAPDIMRTAGRWAASQPRAHPRTSASSPSPPPLSALSPQPPHLQSRTRARTRAVGVSATNHCSSHPGAVYARAGGRGGGQWTLRYPPSRCWHKYMYTCFLCILVLDPVHVFPIQLIPCMHGRPGMHGITESPTNGRIRRIFANLQNRNSAAAGIGSRIRQNSC
jgi:hypothetical protein